MIRVMPDIVPEAGICQALKQRLGHIAEIGRGRPAVFDSHGDFIGCDAFKTLRISLPHCVISRQDISEDV